MRGPLTSSVNVTLGSSIHHSSNTRSDYEQISLETPHGSRDDSTFPLNNRPGGSETGKRTWLLSFKYIKAANHFFGYKRSQDLI